jgi:hypothetical protein
MYYVRIGTKDGKGYFSHEGRTQNFASVTHNETSLNQLNTSEIGLVASQYWQEIPDHFPFVKLEKMILSPNKLQAIIRFEKPGFKKWKSNSFSPQSRNLGSVIRGYKCAVKKYATLHFIDFQWAERYDEMVIKDEAELSKISNIFINYSQ